MTQKQRAKEVLREILVLEGRNAARRKSCAVVLFAAASCFVHVASAEPSKDIALSVRAASGSHLSEKPFEQRII